MDMPTRARSEPSFNLGMLVHALVVHDHMDVQLLRRGGVDGAQKSQELLMAVAQLALDDHRTVHDIQRRKQRRRAVPLGIVRPPRHTATPSSAYVPGLGIGFLIDAEHQSILGWIQIQPHRVAQLLNEEGVSGQLETLGAMRLDTEQFEVTMYAVGYPAVDCGRTHAPMRRALSRVNRELELRCGQSSYFIDPQRHAEFSGELRWCHLLLDVSCPSYGNSGFHDYAARNGSISFSAFSIFALAMRRS